MKIIIIIAITIITKILVIVKVSEIQEIAIKVEIIKITMRRPQLKRNLAMLLWIKEDHRILRYVIKKLHRKKLNKCLRLLIYRTKMNKSMEIVHHKRVMEV